MAAPDLTKVQRATGYLIKSPQSGFSSFPYGGTALGVFHDVRLEALQRIFVVTAEEYGGKAVEEYDLGRDWLCSGILKGLDADALATLFPSVSSSIVTEALAQSAGTPLSGRAVKLLFAPRDESHAGFILYRALPRLRESSKTPFQLHGQTAFNAIFRAIPDAAGRDIQIADPFTDITL